MRLREPRLDDSYQTVEWLNDPEHTIYMNKGQYPITIEMQEEFRARKDIIYFAIERNTGDHIGNCSINNIDFIHRSGEIGILIGKPWWREGFGTTAWGLLTDHAFNELGLLRMYAWVMEGNEASCKIASACGYTHLFSVPKMFYRHGAWLKGMYWNRGM